MPSATTRIEHDLLGDKAVPADAYIRLADDLIEATQDTQAFVLYSSCMKSLAIKLSRACNDLRLLSSGPCCGLHEINLPAKTDVQRLFQEY